MNDSLYNTIKIERKMLKFQRLAGTRKIRSYNLAEHSYFVGVMFQEFADAFNISYSVDTLKIVFRHDLMEVFTTDLPWQVKHASPKTEEAWNSIETEVYNQTVCRGLLTDEQIKVSLTEEQYCLFKWCDTLELLLFCLEERAMGNSGSDMTAVIENCKSIVNNPDMNIYGWHRLLENIVRKSVEDSGL